MPASFDSPARSPLPLPLLPLSLPLPLAYPSSLFAPLSLLGTLSPSPLTFLSLLLLASASPSPSLPHCRLPLLTTPHPPTSMSQQTTPRRITSPSLSSPGGQENHSLPIHLWLVGPTSSLPRIPPLRHPPLYPLHLPPPFLEPLPLPPLSPASHSRPPSPAEQPQHMQRQKPYFLPLLHLLICWTLPTTHKNLHRHLSFPFAGVTVTHSHAYIPPMPHACKIQKYGHRDAGADTPKVGVQTRHALLHPRPKS